MELWDKIQRGMEAGFDAALVAVHNLTEMAGEGIELTRLRREKARLENQVTRFLAQVGSAVYEKISEGRREDLAKELGIEEKIRELASCEARMENIERRLTEEIAKDERISSEAA